MFGKNEIVGQKYFEGYNERHEMLVTSMFLTLQGEGPFAGMPALFIRLAKCNLACTFCLVGNTYVTMGDYKRKKIKDVKVGETVISWDEKQQKFTPNKVTKVYETQATRLLKLNFSPTNQIFTTGEHPFLVKDAGWVKADDLKLGDVVLHLPSSVRMKNANPMMNPKTARKVSEKQKGKPGYLNVAWDNADFRRKNVLRMKQNNPMKNPETAIKGFLNRKDLAKKTYIEERFERLTSGLCSFVGDGKLIVNNLCPDFKVNGQQKVIEVWDSEQTEYWGRDSEYEQDRRAKLEAGGYDVLFLPFCRKDSDGHILEKTANFINNGYTLTEKREITQADRAAWVRFTNSKESTHVNTYNLEVENAHTYVASSLIVHNCDTYFDSGDKLNFNQIDLLITETINSYFKEKGLDVPEWASKREMVLVMTGGEPMLQKGISDFLEWIGSSFKYTQIETNGTQHQDIPKSTVLVVSPKCLERDGHATKYLAPRKTVIERADCLKFVMTADKNSPYSDIPDWAHEWARTTGKPVYISPMNMYNDEPLKSKQLRSEQADIKLETRSKIDEVISFWEPGLLDMKENQRNHEYTARFCIEHGYRLNLQMHLYASLA